MLCGAGGALAEEPLRIGEIRIHTLDVFAPEEEARGWVYRAANGLHIETQEAVIRRFLLFEEGEAYDPSLLAQTERNLRALPFLRSATVTALAPRDGTVDVDVVTKDAWTTALAVKFGRGGGVVTWAAGVTEQNVLGLGKEVGFLYDDDVERTTRRFQYKDPSLLASYWAASVLYADNSDGYQRLVGIRRPFVSSVDPHAGDAFWNRFKQDDRIYSSGVVESEFSQRHEQVRISGGMALSRGSSRARRLAAGIDFFQDEFTALPGQTEGPLPTTRDFRYVFVGFEDVQTDFISERFVNRSERMEDFNLGTRIAAQVGISPRAFGAPDNSFAVAAEFSSGWRIGSDAFLQAGATFRSRLDGGIENGMLHGILTFVWKHPTHLLQTTVAQLAFDRGWNLDRDIQFFADGDHGLRGYHLYAFEGNRRIVANVEHRIFGGFEVLQLFSLGAAVFVDSGVAVPPGVPLTLSSLKTDAGVGLRIGISRSASSSVLRLDCAYAFNEDPLGRRGWLLSFSGGQAF